ncbi:glycosyltransferase family 1 protein [Mesorhizobium sp. M1C.F.Ca.ET.193.01.1.1]|uniref:glycosyltransferase n=1 Tax=unclassified Mesorhizobium TaxID=325217 RepID=UPI000FD506A3|nr:MULTISPECIES: glycosyltransferase [unclassified Mesorhizobium]TGS99010.1 glycosyltransferase family 1 protein [bacterium M00.F.Ca.ET.177.01.1.1]TGQ53051.1 glycosyltransferase family 1 protein [Mesorhizobium sp. M1C.F.Ca.ET.210.01.1.1]TGQ70329.1 glycosyltransferase family 1 protein [Mesorhizobium sp. M1C.F.Ca.ET.212.01.1.1]TGR06659.1 glycosyltransferase family 1 protein [Mesorhizobium sp. M1C.F.Ca.ET.204.01.1.1]TGR27182.1 glycosyltransferase family 1 protein [Mesorhizobium sp. M1C.F.Ca.ET.19
MKIVHVLTRLLRAGSEENTLACCLAQARHGHEVLLVHGEEYDPGLRASVAGALRVVTLGNLINSISPSRDISAFGQLTRLMRDWQPDIVHTHQSKAGIVGRLAAREAHIPGIVHGVHILPFVHVGVAQRLIFLAAERLAAKFTRAYIDVSQAMRDICIANHLGRPDQHHVVHSGFDLARFANAKWPQEPHLLLGTAVGEPKPPVVLMLAALEPRKRHVEFIESFGQVVDRIPNVRLLVAGEGPARSAVESAIERSPFANNVRMIGYHREPERLISLADVCVLTSMREGLPRVMMQYLAGGRASVISHLPGVEEIVKHGVNAIVTPAEDVGAAAAAVADLLENQHYRARLADGAKLTDLSSWGLESMCERVELIYQSVLESAPSAAKPNEARIRDGLAKQTLGLHGF